MANTTLITNLGMNPRKRLLITICETDKDGKLMLDKVVSAILLLTSDYEEYKLEKNQALIITEIGPD